MQEITLTLDELLNITLVVIPIVGGTLWIIRKTEKTVSALMEHEKHCDTRWEHHFRLHDAEKGHE